MARPQMQNPQDPLIGMPAQWASRLAGQVTSVLRWVLVRPASTRS
jgi:hypothetical protein